MQTLNELRTFLNTESLKTRIQFQSPNFSAYIDGEEMYNKQTVYVTANSQVDARYWVRYEVNNNKFVLDISFFSRLGDYIPLSTFAAQYPDSQATFYGESCAIGKNINWTPISPGNNIYSINVYEENHIKLRQRFTNDYSLITKIA